MPKKLIITEQLVTEYSMEDLDHLIEVQEAKKESATAALKELLKHKSTLSKQEE
jgi:hypothetical protein